MSQTYEHILSIDDDPHLLELLKLYLEDSGFEVTTTTKPTEALKIFEEIKPDLVLTDLHMPTMSGIELLSSLKESSPNTPVVILSGQGDMSDAIGALQLGAADYLLKPFSRVSLEHAVCRALDKFRLLKQNENYRLMLEKKNIELARSLEQLEVDQKAGKNVQQLLLPKEHAQFDGYSLTYKVIPSLYLSGDFIDYFKINDRHVAFYIADVSGHGASSAFVTVMLKGMVEKIQESFQRGSDDIILHPEKLLKKISDTLLAARLGKYLTMIYCVLDLNENTLVYSVGGHYPNPILYNGEKAVFLEGQGFAVGIHQQARFESRRCELPLQFTLAMFSDGIFEVMNGKNQTENEKNLLTMVKKSSHINDILEPLGTNQMNGAPDDVACLIINKDNMFGQVSH
ncbi:MAG: hypothetical protein BGO43_09280 [Gammaproteobacteria bacterium 39-13]|nr:fused response regulator/phosphatase [Gammaproteobacteria bacterium]OJV93834.1 MAG: hypothetical protein BGO43_09280 [Gammaproteobacteria bacterium 39-13]